MGKWTFWDWCGYSALGFATLFLALVEGFRKLPIPPEFAAWPIWSFLPLGLFLIGSGILFARQMKWIGSERTVGGGLTGWPDPYDPKIIASRTFINETVVFDGVRYEHCKFINCTYKYNGTTPVQFNNCIFEGQKMLMTDAASVFGTFFWLYSLGVTTPMNWIGLPPGTKEPGQLKETL